jgi:peptide/nickel transport system substrate-binding protein
MNHKLVGMDWDKTVALELALTKDVSPDGKVWTFTIPDNVTWHDGVHFTTDDLKWHYEQLASGEFNPIEYTFIQGLESIETPDPYTITFTFNETNKGLAFGEDVHPGSMPIPRHIYEGTDIATNPANWMPIGIGPFKVTEYVRDKYVIMEAFEDYYKGRPYLDRLIWTYYGTKEAALIALEAGEVDYVHPRRQVPFAEIPRLRADPKYGAMGGTSTGSWRLTFNFREDAVAQHPWLADRNVRLAISKAIDRETIIEEVLYNATKPSYTQIPEWLSPFWHNPDVDAEQFKYDPVGAETLLDQAGYTRDQDGWRFSVELLALASASGEAEVIREYLRAIGIDCTLVIVENTTFFSEFYAPPGLGTYAMSFNFMGQGPDPEWAWRTCSTEAWPPVSYNIGYYNNSRMDEILSLGGEPFDPELRKPYYDEVQEICAEDIPFAYLWGTFSTAAWNSEFVGLEKITPWFGDNWHALNEVWWKLGEPATSEPTPPGLEAKIDALIDEMTSLRATLSQVATLTYSIVVIVIIGLVIGIIALLKKRQT